MDFIFELLFEIIFEGVFEGATNRKVPMILRIFCAVLSIGFFVALIAWLMHAAASTKNGICITLTGLICAGLVAGVIYGFIKKSRE